jgi:hypothetical protein
MVKLRDDNGVMQVVTPMMTGYMPGDAPTIKMQPAKRKYIANVLPYTKEDLAVAEAWMAESGCAETCDRDDLQAVTQSLAEAIAKHVESQR